MKAESIEDVNKLLGDREISVTLKGTDWRDVIAVLMIAPLILEAAMLPPNVPISIIKQLATELKAVEVEETAKQDDAVLGATVLEELPG